MNTDEYYMKEALKIAKEALKHTEVPVGCVIVNKNGEIIAKKRNKTKEKQNGTLHAEILCIQSLSKQKDINFNELILFVTVEPCIMCAEALKQIGLNKIIFGCSNVKFGGCQSIMKLIPTIPYTIEKRKEYENNDEYCFCSFMEEESLELLHQFFATENMNAPEHLRRKKESKK